MRKKYQTQHKNLKPSIIPRSYLELCCYGDAGSLIEECEYYVTTDCPNECSLAYRLSKGITHKTRTGIERFKEKYPNYPDEVLDAGRIR